MTDSLITSPTNPRLKALVGLRRRRQREQSGLTLLEGYDEISLALSVGARPREIFYCPDLMLNADEQYDVIEATKSAGARAIQLSRAAFEKVAYREGADGFLAVMPTINGQLDSLALRPDPLLLVADGVEKPGNLGAMLRTADAAGVDAVISAEPMTDWGNPNVMRSSKGTVFSVPVAAATTQQTLAWTHTHGIQLIAATPDTDTLHTEVDLTGSIAIAVGAEKYGLIDEFLAAADHRMRIPMVGKVNSLNVGTSAAIVLYEAVRQRTTCV